MKIHLLRPRLFRPLSQALVLAGLIAAAQSSTGAEKEATSKDQAASVESGTQVQGSEKTADRVSEVAGQVQDAQTLTAPEAPMGHLDGAGISEMQQAREAAAMQQELEGVSGGMQGMAGREGSLTGPADDLLGGRRGNDRFSGNRGQRGRPGNDGYADPMGEYGVDLPGNRDKAPGSAVGMPSSNPRDWMSGADGSVYVDSVETSIPGKKPRKNKYVKPAKKYVKPGKPVKPDKPVKPVKPVKPKPKPKLVKPKPKPTKPVKPDKGIAKMVDPNADTGGNQAVCATMPWVCNRGKPSRQTTLVNPGNDPDDTQQTAARINPGNSIVTNPVLEHARQGTPQTEEGIRRSIEGGTLIDPPNPDGPG